MSEIGFIGVGNMGAPMVRNLLRAGHRVTVFDLSSQAVQAALQAGARAAGSAAEAARNVDVVITMLPAGGHVRDVYLSQNGLLTTVPRGSLFIDSSTIDIESARAVAAAAADFDMVDAPVSGGVAGAEAATLTFMVGGTDAAFARAKPYLEAMGKTIVHAGASGAGQAAKICNNMILGISMIAVCEAFVLADKLGLDRQRLFDISSKSSGQCWSLTSYCPVPGPVPTSPANRGYAAGFTADMMLKDLNLAQAAATGVAATTPLGAAAAKLYAEFSANGQGGKDFSGIIEMLRVVPR
jgi:3-hydroxyisobutyrate dehydrogenase